MTAFDVSLVVCWDGILMHPAQAAAQLPAVTPLHALPAPQLPAPQHSEKRDTQQYSHLGGLLHVPPCVCHATKAVLCPRLLCAQIVQGPTNDSIKVLRLVTNTWNLWYCIEQTSHVFAPPLPAPRQVFNQLQYKTGVLVQSIKDCSSLQVGRVS